MNLLGRSSVVFHGVDTSYFRCLLLALVFSVGNLLSLGISKLGLFVKFDDTDKSNESNNTDDSCDSTSSTGFSKISGRTTGFPSLNLAISKAIDDPANIRYH